MMSEKCVLCGKEFDTSKEHPQRRFSVICLECDLAAWEIENAPLENVKRRLP